MPQKRLNMSDVCLFAFENLKKLQVYKVLCFPEDSIQSFKHTMPTTYGTVEYPERTRTKIYTNASLRVVALVAISSAALITLLALARGPVPQTSRRWLLQTNKLGSVI
jgi:hypothetical protein